MADELCDAIRECGCEVVGPIGHVTGALRLLQECEVDGAVVDIDLHGSSSFSVCDELQRRKVPFFFVSASDRSVIPPAFSTRRLLSKPIDLCDFREAMAELTRASAHSRNKRGRLGNVVLEMFGQAGLQALGPKLKYMALRRGQILHSAGQRVNHVHFPTSGLVSLLAQGARRRRIEVALVGREGMAGIAVLLDNSLVSRTDAIVQLPGAAWRIPASDLVHTMRDHRELRDALLRYVHTLLDQISQTVIATGHAKLEQRVARWLLMASNRCGTNQVAVTHEHLSQRLALRRSGITVALHVLEGERIIRSQRRLIEILDHDGLVRAAGGFFDPSEQFAS
jgi:CRP-like cAMP-binding protein